MIRPMWKRMLAPREENAKIIKIPNVRTVETRGLFSYLKTPLDAVTLLTSSK